MNTSEEINPPLTGCDIFLYSSFGFPVWHFNLHETCLCFSILWSYNTCYIKIRPFRVNSKAKHTATAVQVIFGVLASQVTWVSSLKVRKNGNSVEFSVRSKNCDAGSSKYIDVPVSWTDGRTKQKLDSMQQSHFTEVNSRSATHDIPHLLCQSKIRQHIQNSPPMASARCLKTQSSLSRQFL